MDHYLSIYEAQQATYERLENIRFLIQVMAEKYNLPEDAFLATYELPASAIDAMLKYYGIVINSDEVVF